MHTLPDSKKINIVLKSLLFSISGDTVNSVMQAEAGKEYLKVRFGDGSKAKLPYVWLRDNCQCPECFSTEALGRKLIITDLELDVHPLQVQVSFTTVR